MHVFLKKNEENKESQGTDPLITKIRSSLKNVAILTVTELSWF